jgi:GGDEF domain-containing protein
VAVSDESQRDPAVLLAQADQAMYEAKRQRKKRKALDGLYEFGDEL